MRHPTVFRPASALACAAWVAAGAALAQPASPSPAAAPPAASGSTVVSGVVVQVRPKAQLEAFARTVDQFVKAQGKTGPLGQISRWNGPVCPATEGLADAFDNFVSSRIIEVALRIGAPAGGCAAPNVRVVFTPDPEALMADVRDHHPGLLGFHYRGETRFLAEFEPPMKSWYVTGTRFTYFPVAGRAEGGIDPPPKGVVDAPSSLMVKWECSQSHIRCEKASSISYVLVVVDARRVEGFTIGAVADEVAMAALSRPGPRTGCSALPSVMDALSPECAANGPVEGLTAYDEAYLKGLYAYQGSEIAAFENSAIAKSIVKTTAPVFGPAPRPSRPRCDVAGRITPASC